MLRATIYVVGVANVSSSEPSSLWGRCDGGSGVNPPPDSVASREDYFGNEVSSFSIHEPHRELIITAHSRAELTPLSPPHLDLSPPWEQVREEAAARKTSA